MKKKRERIKIVITNPEEIPEAKKRFTKLFFDLNKDKILKCIEDLNKDKLNEVK
ncbi:hypothetical protein [Clostridium tyrobutyricum]|uniref:hypothetical protein n=1 Tax=Clostridium tyrobutyricum TaxID=1519 RepID=UPI001C37E90C|nr:hypothetical protein [Clostridium tyrobutyricum]MBV4417149.1 hypothetical protein [Clostridium tyrobutyricum]